MVRPLRLPVCLPAVAYHQLLWQRGLRNCGNPAAFGEYGKPPGVVRDENVHTEVINKTVSFTKELGFGILGLDFSPIKGPEGNIEYLMYIKKNASDAVFDVDDIVKQSHEMLNLQT